MDNQNLKLITYKTGDMVLLNDSQEVVMVVTHDRIFWNQDMPSLMKISPLANKAPEKWWKKLWYDFSDGLFETFMVAFITVSFVVIMWWLLHSL